MTSRPADRLLWAVSNYGDSDWNRFRVAFDELYEVDAGVGDSPEYGRYAAARTFDALGHVEAFFGDEWRIVPAPAILAELPLPGLPRAILCGSRSPRTVDDALVAAREVGAQVRCRVEVPDNAYAPTILEFEAESTEVLQRLASRLEIPRAAYPPALALAGGSAALGDYMSRLAWSEVPELNWKRSTFDPRAMRFVDLRINVPSPRLVRYEHPIRGRQYRLWRERSSASVDLLWGLYAVFSDLQMGVMFYDDETVSALVPREAPLPRLLARALTLCSGRPATSFSTPSRPGRRFDRFEGVPPDVYNQIALKVGQPQHRPDPTRRR